MKKAELTYRCLFQEYNLFTSPLVRDIIVWIIFYFGLSYLFVIYSL